MLRVDEAVALVQKGWYIIPLCWPNSKGACACGYHHEERFVGKAPLIPAWPAVRADEEQVREWWQQWPDANAGILLAPSRTVVLDCDDAAAQEKVKALGAEGGWVVRRGERKHVWFRLPEAAWTGRAVKTLGVNLDVLANGYALALGSHHRSGDFYTSDTQIPAPSELPLCPEWVVQAIPKPAELSLQALPETLPPPPNVNKLKVSSYIHSLIQDGESPKKRSEACMAVLIALVEAGCSDGEIASLMLHPENKISERYFEKRNTQEKRLQLLQYEIAKAHQMSSAAKQAEDEAKEEMKTPLFRPWTALADEPEADFLVAGIIPYGAITLLVGRPRAGKSVLARQLATAVSSQEDFLGWKIKENAPVMYWVTMFGEGRPRSFYEHLKALGAKEGIYVHFGEIPRWETWLEAEIERLHARLLIIDTLRGLKNIDWNDYAAATHALEPIAKLSVRLQTAVVVVHHAGKSEVTSDITRAALGSTGVTGSADVVLLMDREADSDDESGENKPRTLKGVGRDVADIDNVLLEFDGVRFVNKGKKSQAKLRDTQEKLLAILPPTPNGLPFHEVKALLPGVGENAVRQALTSLCDADVVLRSGGGRSTCYSRRVIQFKKGEKPS